MLAAFVCAFAVAACGGGSEPAPAEPTARRRRPRRRRPRRSTASTRTARGGCSSTRSSSARGRRARPQSRKLAAYIKARLPRGRYENLPGGLRNVVGEIPGQGQADPARRALRHQGHRRASSAPTTARAAPRRCSSWRAGSQRAKRPKDAPPIRFIAFDGEEATDDNDFYGTGLRGSKPYARKHATQAARGRADGLHRRQGPRDPARGVLGRGDVGRPAGGRLARRRERRVPGRDAGRPCSTTTRRSCAAGVPSIDLIDFTFDCWHETCDDMQRGVQALAGHERRDRARVPYDGPVKTLYTAVATATDEGRNGRSRTDDGTLDLQMALPPSMGGDGSEGTNPEQLFAAGYAACFANAMRSSARRDGDESVVDGRDGHRARRHRRDRPGPLRARGTARGGRAGAGSGRRPRRWSRRRTSAARTRTRPRGQHRRRA